MLAIIGARMPESCHDCPLQYDFEWCIARDDGNTDPTTDRLLGCPLVEAENIETKEP